MSSLLSSSWYRAADLRPRLRRQARVSRHRYRGERWYVLQDQGTGQFLRLNPAAYRAVALMDGERTLDEIWRNVCLTQGDDAPTQDEILQVLSRLHQANVLISDRRPDLGELEERRERTHAAKIKQYLSNPLSLKIPLIDPDAFLTGLVRRVPGNAWFWLLLWAGVVLAGATGAVYQWDALTHDLTARVFNTDNMLIMALVFPVLKAIHELGHGIAIKASGGACREMGVMFLVFIPVPYVDASQATAFPQKGRRMLVGAAGMMIELAFASIALLLWDAAEPGLSKAILHQVVILAGLTTLAFNLNPLLRFDGYYILADWLEIPNLGQKSTQYIGYLVQRYLFGAHRLSPPPTTPRESAWLVSYAIGSFAYRMLVAATIILLVAGKFFFIGVLLAGWAGWSMVLRPVVRALGQLSSSPQLEQVRWRAWSISLALTAVVAWLLFIVPAPSGTSTEGIVWATEDARLRTAYPCFGDAVLVAAGTRVTKGERLIACSEPELDAQIAQERAHVAELEARLAEAIGNDRVQVQIASAGLRFGESRLADLIARRDAMTIVSPHDGTFVMASPNDFSGRFLNRGEVVGYVIVPSRLTLLTVVPQGEVALVRQRTERVELRIVGDVWNPIRARIAREVPAATQDLPSLALSLAGGGNIGLEPEGTQGGEMRALTPLFQFELMLDGDALPGTLGRRVFVRFEHDAEPLADQWYRGLRQMFLKRFTV